MRHLFYLHNLPLPDKVAAQKKIKNKIPARLYIYFPYGEISNKKRIELIAFSRNEESHYVTNMPQRSNRKHALPSLLEYALLTTNALLNCFSYIQQLQNQKITPIRGA